ncbi:adenosine deaminase domain-containing protein 1 isoform X1 [Erpetoichthys calabaricus]|uniref:adenosine deaminase domain-containing protein 1 isoform X1 n=1 Tax=Erpetoichthys calabaricus TaxID=27687 RepID=UPI002234BCBD|nr:adenosine deaminase domain-containing protein 1 isoform X1 [Erpetoichthys calabaricus]
MLSQSLNANGPRGPNFAQILKMNVAPRLGFRQFSLAPRFSFPSNSSSLKSKEEEVVSKPDKFGQNPFSQPELISDEFLEKCRDGTIHAVSALYQLSQVQQFVLEFKETTTPDSNPGLLFAFCAVINGIKYKTGLGKKKKDAKASAAKLALDELLQTLVPKSVIKETTEGSPLLPINSNDVSCPKSISGKFGHGINTSPFSRITECVQRLFNSLLDKYPEFYSCGSTVAAFIIESPTVCEVVALGTETCNTSENVTGNGRIVHDSHAVVTARRSLLRYFYRQLLLFYSRNSSVVEKSIFQPDNTTKLLCLKPNITVHLYLNQLPKGTSQFHLQMRLNPHSAATYELNNQLGLHVNVEGNLFSVFSCQFNQVDTKLMSISGIDKLTQWEVLGFQGALLSHFIEPVYISNIIIGGVDCNDVGGMEIALKQRVDGITSKLPLYYCVYRPHISIVPAVFPHRVKPAQKFIGLNWIQGDLSLEVVDGKIGKSVESSPFKTGAGMASRLCKAAMWSRFKLVAKEANRKDLLNCVTYKEGKVMAKPYQEAKNIFRTYLHQHGFGTWITKSPLIEQFSI